VTSATRCDTSDQRRARPANDEWPAELAAIPVVIVTVEDDDGRSQDLGADDYLTKPIDRARLGRWLARVAAREELAVAVA